MKTKYKLNERSRSQNDYLRGQWDALWRTEGQKKQKLRRTRGKTQWSI